MSTNLPAATVKQNGKRCTVHWADTDTSYNVKRLSLIYLYNGKFYEVRGEFAWPWSDKSKHVVKISLDNGEGWLNTIVKRLAEE